MWLSCDIIQVHQSPRVDHRFIELMLIILMGSSVCHNSLYANALANLWLIEKSVQIQIVCARVDNVGYQVSGEIEGSASARELKLKKVQLSKRNSDWGGGRSISGCWNSLYESDESLWVVWWVNNHLHELESQGKVSIGIILVRVPGARSSEGC